MNMNHPGPVNIKSGSVLVDDLEELPSVSQMDQDSLLAKSMCQTQSQQEVEATMKDYNSHIGEKTISRLR